MKKARIMKQTETTKQTRTKGQEIIKIVAASVLSIGLFSASFIGFNQLTFAAATDEATPLPPAATSTAYTQDAQQPEAEAETFVPPTLTLIESPYQHLHPIPAAAMSMAEAAQVGARYIWDIFGTDIDSLYVEMAFAAHASQTNTWWTGVVFLEDPKNPTQNYIISEGEAFALPVYMFTVNGITGERINISFMAPQGRIVSGAAENETGTSTLSPMNGRSSRMSLLEGGWFDMNIDEQIAFANISDEAIAAYTQIAARLAQAQFNNSNVVDLRLMNLGANGMIGNTVDIASLAFMAIDNTGREALISIPATDADAAFRSIFIHTEHNDFVPGFEYVPSEPGRG